MLEFSQDIRVLKYEFTLDSITLQSLLENRRPVSSAKRKDSLFWIAFRRSLI